MKNFIKNFSQFKRLNEQKENNLVNHPNGYKSPYSNDNDLYEDVEDFGDLLDQITDRLFENTQNGTLGSSVTIKAIHPSTKEYAKYPLVNINFDRLTGQLSVTVGAPFLTEEDEEEVDGWQRNRGLYIETFKIIDIIIKEVEPGVSVSYRGKDDNYKVYGPYTGFYELTDSISQYLINDLEDKNVDNQNITKSDLEDFDSNISLDDYDSQDYETGDDEDLSLDF